MLNLQPNEYPEDVEQREPSVRLRIPLAGLVIALSLLSGAAAGIFAYRYAANRSRPRSVASALVAPAQPAVQTPAAGETAAPNEPPVIQEKPATGEKPAVGKQAAVRRVELRLMNGDQQLTISLDQMVPYDAHRLDHPERIYVDLHGAHLAPEVASRAAAVKQDGISGIRLGQIPPDTVRVVLDLDQRFDYSIRQQENPAAVVLKLMPHTAARHERHPSARLHKKATGRNRVNRES